MGLLEKDRGERKKERVAYMTREGEKRDRE